MEEVFCVLIHTSLYSAAHPHHPGELNRQRLRVPSAWDRILPEIFHTAFDTARTVTVTQTSL